jgi:large repetitive protein
MARRVGSCGGFICALAGVVVALPGSASAARSGPLGLAITDGPTGTVASRTATFTFTASPKTTSFTCSLDGAEPTPCNDQRVEYAGLADGTHRFVVRAQAGTPPDDVTDNASRSWIVAVPPETHIDSRPAPTVQTTTAVFTFSADPQAASFECSLDGRPFEACASPKTYGDLTRARHHFEVRAVTEVGSDQTPAFADWDVLAPSPLPATQIVSGPAGTTHRAAVTFVFASDPVGGTFECSLDDGPFAPCPATYTTAALRRGRHRLRVRSVTPAGRDPTPELATWTFAPALRLPQTFIVEAPSGDRDLPVARPDGAVRVRA